MVTACYINASAASTHLVAIASAITLETTNVDAYELGSTLDETVKVGIADKTAIKSALAI